MPGAKIGKEIEVEDDGTTVILKEDLPRVAPSMIKKTVKRERTEAQKANFEKVVAANKERWAKLRAEKEAAVEAHKQAVKEDHQAKIDAGTHIRVQLKEKRAADPTARKHTKKPVPESESESDDLPSRKKPMVYETDTPTETESDSDYDDYKAGKRQVRREIKKNMRAIEKIDNVMQMTMNNPYSALLASRWK